MAFDKTNWANGGNGTSAPAIHTYKSTDTAATMNTSGYFNTVANDVRVGDLIYVYADTGGTPQGYFLAINSNSSGVVDVTDGLAVGTTDSD
jgi:hypothetical protein